MAGIAATRDRFTRPAPVRPLTGIPWPPFRRPPRRRPQHRRRADPGGVLRSPDELVHHRPRVAGPVRLQRFNTAVCVGEDPGGQRHGDMAGQPAATQHLVHQCPADTAVPVDERVDRVELGGRDRDRGQRQVGGPVREPPQVVEVRRDPVMVRRMKSAPTGVDPRAAVAQQRALHRDGRVGAEVVDPCCFFHRFDVRCDHPGVHAPRADVWTCRLTATGSACRRTD